MNFVQSAAVIPVDLHVSQYRMYSEDGLVEVWGHVGDYEVCVFLPIAQAQACGLLPGERHPTGAQRPKLRAALVEAKIRETSRVSTVVDARYVFVVLPLPRRSADESRPLGVCWWTTIDLLIVGNAGGSNRHRERNATRVSGGAAVFERDSQRAGGWVARRWMPSWSTFLINEREASHDQGTAWRGPREND